jgi:ABC-type dipeptide/oligopeptide/nickel transport system ATPase component
VALLEVAELSVAVTVGAAARTVVDQVGFELAAREVLAIVGESGSGKSMTARAMLNLLPAAARVLSGRVIFEGADLLTLGEEALRSVRGGRIGLVAQDPLSALNPILPIGRQISESLRLHLRMSRKAARERAVELLDQVGIARPRAVVDDYPHQLSGGMRQRAMIAMAIACDPAVLIADEPTTALDVTIQAQIIELIEAVRERLGMAVAWITHDLGVVARLASRVVVMQHGRVVEQGDVDAIFSAPLMPYTKTLLNSVARIDRPRRRTLGEPAV